VDINTVVKAPEGVIHTEMNDEVVLMHVANGTYYSLNEVGSTIWSLLSSPLTISDICKSVEKEYEVSIDECKEDVMRLIQELYGVGLVEIVES